MSLNVDSSPIPQPGEVSRMSIVATGVTLEHWRAYHGYIARALRWARRDGTLAQAEDIKFWREHYDEPSVQEDRLISGSSSDKTRDEGRYDNAEAALRTSPVPLLVLKGDLRVKTANESFYETFQVDVADTKGRLIYDLGNGQWNIPKLRELLEGILPQCTMFRNFEVAHAFESIGARVMLLSARRMKGEPGCPDSIVLVIEDITERKKAEEALRDSEARLLAATTAGAVGTWSWDLATNLISCNPALGRIFGFSPADAWHGMSPEAFIAAIVPADQPKVREAIAQAFLPDSDGVYEAEYRVGALAGEVRWVFARGQVEFDATRRPTRLPGALTDITERKEAEEQVKRGAELLHVLIDRAPTGFYIVDADLCFSHMNADSQARAFRNVNPAIGRRLDDAMRVLWPEPLATEIIGIFRHTLETGEPYRSLGLTSPRADLEWVETYEWQLERITMPNGRPAVVCYYYDTTPLREAEQKLRRSQERFDIVKAGAQVGFWFCDLPFDELIWDARVKEHFWLAPDAPVTIETFYERIHPEDRERTRATIEASIAEHTQYEIEYRTVCAQSAAQKWVRAVGRTFYNDAGQPIRFDGVTLDVTKRRQDEDALRTAKEQAEASSRAKDNFLAQLSHELRTPLTPVLMTAAALREDLTLPVETRNQLAMIERNVALEARLIDDLLDLTRITRGKLALRSEPCDAHSLLGLVVEIVREEAREKAVAITLELAARRSALVGDPARLQQVFWNLLRNAVKFTPSGGNIRILSRDHFDYSDGQTPRGLRIEISDDGAGFAPEEAERIFQPFEQGSTKQTAGLGLGLAIARAIVELHQGTVWAASAGPGCGAIFSIEFPAATDSSALGIAPPSSHPRDPESAFSEPLLRLLVVEDHPATLEVLSRLLVRAGHSVVTAGTVVQARAAAAAHPFDAVISDLGLPDGTGIELMYSLRAEHGLRGIALSGYGMEEDLRRSAAAGFIAHLIKPVDMNELRRAIARLGHPTPAKTSNWREAPVAPPSSL